MHVGLALSLLAVTAAADEPPAGPPLGLLPIAGDERIAAMQRAYLDRLAAPRNPRAATAEEWRERRETVRRHVLESLGLTPAPPAVPLDLHWGGKLTRDGYTVQRLYWQSWPGYYAAGYLYLPSDLRAPAPAVLNPHGHWSDGNRDPVVQARMIGLARRGYVALTVDSVHAYDYYAGVTPLTVMTRNNLRALDLLCAMPEVDPARIGITGCSGGGQQTFYLQAIDDRLAAAVPVCMVSEIRRILQYDWPHCPCNHVAGLAVETDQTELSACFAPRPTLYLCVTQDWTRWFPTEGYPEIRSVYGLLGAGEAVDLQQYDWHHDYSQPMRERMYAWFGRWLKGTDDPAEAVEAPFEPEPLETLATLDDPPADDGLEAVYRERRAARVAPPMAPDELRAALRRLLREEGTEVPPAFEPLGRTSVDGLTVSTGLVASEVDVAVPVLRIEPPRTGPLPAVVIADSRGLAELVATEWSGLRRLAERGLAVVLADPRFVGEHSARGEAQRLNGILFGRPEAAVGTHDLLAVTRWLRTQAGIDGDRIALVGLGDCGPTALMATLLDLQIAAAAVPAVGSTYAAGRTTPVASHLVTVGDLPEIAAACAPRPVWISGPSVDMWPTAPGRMHSDADVTLRSGIFRLWLYHVLGAG